MKRISAWFEWHPRTRIALQLVLDGLPFLMVLYCVCLLFLELDECVQPGWWDSIAIGCMYFLMFGGGAVLFGMGIWLRSRASVEFECYPGWKVLSFALRLLSAVPAIISFGSLIGCIYTYFSK